jgi:hypothetical protein
MNITSGYQLEQPQVLVCWGISEEQLQELFQGSELHGTKGFFFIRCTSLCGLSHNLNFRFSPRDGALYAFELSGNGGGSLEASYRKFQNHLEITFGPPTETAPGEEEGFPSQIWRIKDVQIIHAVQEHFGPAESLRITKSKPSS